ncbi:MAG: tRNA uridine-5-carboxymethylaminomethyl(34) synthesis enzyme MnmG [Candidatus Nasuia deltocephalinicola]
MTKIIIVGGGNAGVEAANIICKMNNQVLLITNNIENIGELSCNPSMGGLGKSQLIREVDALGGLIGKLSTLSSYQLKKINISKGEAVSCIRSQICREKYKNNLKKIIKINKIKIIQDCVKKIVIKNNIIKGVKTENNFYESKAVIITTGTFLGGQIHIGKKKYLGGRINEKISNRLSEQLKSIFGNSKKFKTGTPPRISNKNINLKNLKIQKGDSNPIPSLSYWLNLKNINIKKNCWITKTTEKSKEIIKNSLNNSPIYKNLIDGTSPRYCPSIEDKYYKFYKKKKHNVFLEPENKNEFYPNGVSTSIPYIQQIKFLKSIEGLENCMITKPGYAVEYNFFSPKNLKKSLESKVIKGLFFAGQINGTTGYEEAAAQGIIAGINSSLYIKKKKYWYPNKKNSYIGLMLNDIIKRGVTEPYRIFTSRSKNRFNLREENSVERFNNVSKNLNLINKKKINYLKKIKLYQKKKSLNNIIMINKIKKQINIYFKYINYIKLNKLNEIKKRKFLKNFKICKIINYFKINGLSKENSEKLNKLKPVSINEIFKIIENQNQINIILNYLKNK